MASNVIERNIPVPQVGDTVEHNNKQRVVTGVQDFGYKWRVWVEYDARTENSGTDGYFEIVKPGRKGLASAVKA